jgi:hypothetical protein
VALRLVSSGDGRALAIRDHLLPLAREHGTLETQRGEVRVVALVTGPWRIEHWTPFADLSPDEASSPGYRHAVERQRARPDLPYGLDVRRDGARVLGVLWSDDGASEVVAFVRGPWEDEALALAPWRRRRGGRRLPALPASHPATGAGRPRRSPRAPRRRTGRSSPR